MSEWHAHVTVATIVEQQQRFLLVEEIIDGERLINQPAGHLEADESICEAAVRETLEETGWDVTPRHLVGLHLYRAGNGITYYRNTIAADAVTERSDYTLDDGIIGPVWMTLAEIEHCPNLRSPMVLATIRQYLDGHRYPLDIFY